MVWSAVGVNGINQTVIGATTSTHFSDYQATMCQYANGRLIAANLNDLVEVNADGTTNPIDTHDNLSFVWTCVRRRTQRHLRRRQQWRPQRALFHRAQVRPLPRRAPLRRRAARRRDHQQMTFYKASCCSRRARACASPTRPPPTALSYGTVVKVPTVPIASSRERSSSGSAGGTTTPARPVSVARRLATFITDLTPAYSSDLMATAQGITTSVVTYGIYRYFAVAGVGVFAEFANLVPSGTIQTGWVNFSTTERKVSVSVDVRHEPLAGAVVGVRHPRDRRDRDRRYLRHTVVARPRHPDGLRPDLERILRAHVHADAQRRRRDARPDPPLVDLPCAHHPVAPGGDPHSDHSPHRGRGDRLRRRSSSLVRPARRSGCTSRTSSRPARPVAYQEGTQSYLGYIEQVDSIQDKERQWTPDRSFLEGLVVIRFITLSPAA